MRSHGAQSAKVPKVSLSGKKKYYCSSDFRERFFLEVRVNLGPILDKTLKPNFGHFPSELFASFVLCEFQKVRASGWNVQVECSRATRLVVRSAELTLGALKTAVVHLKKLFKTEVPVELLPSSKV